MNRSEYNASSRINSKSTHQIKMPTTAKTPQKPAGPIKPIRPEEGHVYKSVPPSERPILESLFVFRKNLHALRKESHDALTLADVNAKAKQLSEIMKQLRDARLDSSDFESRNWVDDMLDAVWMQMFAIWGKIAAVDESLYPTYVQLVVLSRTVDALRQSRAWTPVDVLPLQERLAVLDEAVADAEGKFLAPGATDKIPHGQAVLMSLHSKIHRSITFMVNENDSVDDNMTPIVEELMQIQQQLAELQGKGYRMDDLAHISKRLHHLDSGKGPYHIISNRAGHATIAGYLNVCFDVLTDMVADLDPVLNDSPLHPHFQSLQNIHASLKTLDANESLKHNQALLSKELSRIQGQLAPIESLRVAGIFTPEGTEATTAITLRGQANMHKLLHSIHALVSQIVEPVAGPLGDRLVHSYEVLVKMRAKLRRLRAWSCAGWNVRADLDAAIAELRDVEATRMKGLFMGDVKGEEDNFGFGRVAIGVHQEVGWETVPMGQAAVSALADECDSLIWQISCTLLH
ncbi:hypothetical protein BC830DRAFT_1146046 [Chytriomyces sp. MP71]|nr:hypothetical protein BC830DRAFT_1146046 [Chytriomyces sp. MP71]